MEIKIMSDDRNAVPADVPESEDDRPANS